MQAAILPRTPLSLTETHHYTHGRYSVWPKVYFQDTQGRIRTVDGNGGGASSIAVDKANMNNSFSAISWGGPETGIQPEERLYYVDESGGIFEQCWSSSRGWYRGDLNGQYRAANYSHLAAVTYGFNSTQHHIQLYYQDPNTDVIREIYKNGNNPWVVGVTHPAGIKGTAIAAFTSPGGTSVWYQLPNTYYVQYSFVSGRPWVRQSFATSLKHDPGAAIAASSPYTVYTVTTANKLAVTKFNTDTGYWRQTEELIPQIPQAAVTAISHPAPYSGNYTESVYCQRKAGEITRLRIGEDGLDEGTLPVVVV